MIVIRYLNLTNRAYYVDAVRKDLIFMADPPTWNEPCPLPADQLQGYSAVSEDGPAARPVVFPEYSLRNSTVTVFLKFLTAYRLGFSNRTVIRK